LKEKVFKFIFIGSIVLSVIMGLASAWYCSCYVSRHAVSRENRDKEMEQIKNETQGNTEEYQRRLYLKSPQYYHDKSNMFIYLAFVFSIIGTLMSRRKEHDAVWYGCWIWNFILLFFLAYVSLSYS